jgi:hypothetical protein
MENDVQLDSDQCRALVRISLAQRIYFWAFVAGLVGFVGGLTLGILGFRLAGYLYGVGSLLVVTTLLISYFVLPVFKCPRCRNRFFTPNGLIRLICKTQVNNHKCVHCGHDARVADFEIDRGAT